MKADERTKRIPVVILTTTEDPGEVAKCYDLGCNVYVTKPVDYEGFSEAVRQLGLFLSVVTVPGTVPGTDPGTAVPGLWGRTTPDAEAVRLTPWAKVDARLEIILWKILWNLPRNSS